MLVTPYPGGATCPARAELPDAIKGQPSSLHVFGARGSIEVGFGFLVAFFLFHPGFCSVGPFSAHGSTTFTISTLSPHPRSLAAWPLVSRPSSTSDLRLDRQLGYNFSSLFFSPVSAVARGVSGVLQVRNYTPSYTAQDLPSRGVVTQQTQSQGRGFPHQEIQVATRMSSQASNAQRARHPIHPSTRRFVPPRRTNQDRREPLPHHDPMGQTRPMPPTCRMSRYRPVSSPPRP
jgi:hypothetical protein